MRKLRFASLLGSVASLSFAAPAAAQSVTELSSLSLEQLAEVEVRSASKRAEPLSEAATSIFVIGNEDVLRSPATSLPEILRLAPNLDVHQLDARQYSISARGFNGYENANKLLVLIDGRSVYTTLHSGVFWELHSPLLEDLEQIEVISGPGGTLFGPNAVNGVVSVATKDARDTLGGLARGSVGANERTLALRYGFEIGAGAALRLYANGFDREEQPDGPGPDADDAFKGYQAGFRMDAGSKASSFTLQGDLFESEIAQMPGDGEEGHNILARWTRSLSAGSAFQFQAYYDRFERRFFQVLDSLQTFDAEAQYNLDTGGHKLVLGAGARTTRDEFINNANAFALDPPSRRLWIFNAFVQDTVAIAETLRLTAGMKLERSSFTGIELLPNLRLAWQPDDQTLLWSSVSRAVRTPSRIDRQLVFLPLLAPSDFRSEKLVAIEAGYRGRPTPTTSLSVSLFYNIYDDIRTTEMEGGVPPIRLENGLHGHTYGVEAWATQQVTPWWRLSFGLATIGKDFELDLGAVDLANRVTLGQDPDYRISARTSVDLGTAVKLDGGVRLVDDLGNGLTPTYVEADARIEWQVSDQLELYVAGSNLLHETHLESNDANRAQRIQRRVAAGTRILF